MGRELSRTPTKGRDVALRLTRYGVDYDAIAETYDSNPLRAKAADPDLLTFLAEPKTGRVAVLDIGCGTGSQLVADQAAISGALLVGLDPFLKMLQVARGKSASICWVQADGMTLPFADRSFDFVSNQFSYHHVDQPDAMIGEAFRVCRPGGRLVLVNMTPHRMQDSALYKWFPDALAADLRAHPTPEALRRYAEDAGFTTLQLDIQTVGGPTALGTLATKYSHKTDCSQLNALPDAVFKAGLRRLRAAAAEDPTSLASDHTAMLRLIADRPA